MVLYFCHAARPYSRWLDDIVKFISFTKNENNSFDAIPLREIDKHTIHDLDNPPWISV